MTLIEVLVAVLVVAIGLLGLAGLQAGALQSNRVAYERTQATILAYDIIERMRANRDAAVDGDYNNALSDMTANGSPSNPVPNDVSEWNNLVSGNLAGGQGAVTTTGACSTCVRVTITWVDREQADPNQNNQPVTQYVYETRL